MANFSSNDYALRVTATFGDLEVVDRTTSEVETSFDLTGEVSVSYENGDYVIEENGSCGGCYEAAFNYEDGDEISFDQSKMGGVTIVRIESLKYVYTYHLDTCPVLLHLEDPVLEVRSPQDSCGTGPAPECVTIEEFELESA